MSYKLKTSERFEKEAKRLMKKYPSLKAELITLFKSVQENPNQGTAIGNGFYKIRLCIESKGRGKRGGARVITYIAVVNETLYLATIYDKSEKANVASKELDEILSSVINRS